MCSKLPGLRGRSGPQIADTNDRREHRNPAVRGRDSLGAAIGADMGRSGPLSGQSGRNTGRERLGGLLASAGGYGAERRLRRLRGRTGPNGAASRGGCRIASGDSGEATYRRVGMPRFVARARYEPKLAAGVDDTKSADAASSLASNVANQRYTKSLRQIRNLRYPCGVGYSGGVARELGNLPKLSGRGSKPSGSGAEAKQIRGLTS